MKNHFNEETSWETRDQILKYNATFSMTDVERANFLGLPEGCRIRENAKIISQENLKIGNNVWIGESAILDASGGLEIGSNTSVGLTVFLWSHDSHKLNQEGNNTQENRGKIRRLKTIIGKNCFIAGPSLIMPGVRVGDNCIIGPMSVVFKDLPNGTIYTPYRDMLNCTEEIMLLKEELSDIKTQLQNLQK